MMPITSFLCQITRGFRVVAVVVIGAVSRMFVVPLGQI